MALIGPQSPSGGLHATLQDLLNTRERLLQQLKRAEELGDLEKAALLEFAIGECDGLIALAMGQAQQS
jgi:hypothetical protein